ncbi:MAG: GNAT family N-acetyltransferase [Planctomycetes bacterium]|nr:GNAT family N-acetyltransferase [Planctomycetota bacterium]
MRESIRYRSTSLEDVSQIEEMEEACFLEEAFGRRQIRYLLQSPNAIALTAEAGGPASASNGKVLGYIIGLGRSGSSAVRIYTFCVKKDYRLKGIGTSLLQRLERECQRRGVSNLVLEVGEDNSSALRFYKRNGFVEFSRTPGYYTDGTTAVRMRKVIASSQ